MNIQIYHILLNYIFTFWLAYSWYWKSQYAINGPNVSFKIFYFENMWLKFSEYCKVTASFIAIYSRNPFSILNCTLYSNTCLIIGNVVYLYYYCVSFESWIQFALANNQVPFNFEYIFSINREKQKIWKFKKHWWKTKHCLRWELNPRPLVYETSALPLSYKGLLLQYMWHQGMQTIQSLSYQTTDE